jgi:hypothetical protein
MAKNEYNNFLVRLTPKVRAMLDKASADMEVPRAHIINFALKAYLGSKYSENSLNHKIDRMLK